MKKYHLLFLGFLFLYYSCSDNKTDRAYVVNKLQSSSKLATVEYVVSKVVNYKKERKIFTDTYFFVETEARIKAGIDLSKLKEEDIVIEEDKINIILPDIEIINFDYPPENFKKIEQYNQEPSFMNWGKLSAKDKDELFRQAEIDIKENIKDLGITKTAQENTRKLLTKILKSLGYKEIYIQFRQQIEEGKITITNSNEQN